MRFLVVCALLAFAFPALAQQRAGWCADGSSYESIHRQNLANLRWSLHSVSQAATAAPINASIRRKLAENSVYSLANSYSIRARFLQGCKIGAEVYHRELAANARYVALFLAAASSPDFPSATLARSGKAPLLLTPPESIAPGQRLAFDEDISASIRAFFGERTAQNDALILAAQRLWGEDVQRSESEVNPAPLIPVSADLSILHQKPLGTSLGALSESGWVRGLEILADYYVRRR